MMKFPCIWISIFCVSFVNSLPVQDLIESNAEIAESTRANKPYKYDRYMKYDEFVDYLKFLEKSNPELMTLRVVGQSSEGRRLYIATITSKTRRTVNNIPFDEKLSETEQSSMRRDRRMPINKVVEVESLLKRIAEEQASHSSTRNSITQKPVVFVDGGIHAREWAAPAAALNIIEKLLNEPSLTTPIEWQIFPMVNPDGYIYSQQKGITRYWRKNRKTHSGSKCVGVDLNRNFNAQWQKTVRDPCSIVYGGPKVFSEPESRAVRDAVLGVKDRIKAYLTIHSYGQFILYPYGYTSSKRAPTRSSLIRMGDGMAQEIFDAYGTRYKVDQASVLGAAAGGSDDWAYMEVKVPYSYTLEMQPSTGRGLSGFALVKRKLPQAVDEIWRAVSYLGRQIKQEFKFNSLMQLRMDNIISRHDMPETESQIYAEVVMDGTKYSMNEDTNSQNISNATSSNATTTNVDLVDVTESLEVNPKVGNTESNVNTGDNVSSQGIEKEKPTPAESADSAKSEQQKLDTNISETYSEPDFKTPPASQSETPKKESIVETKPLNQIAITFPETPKKPTSQDALQPANTYTKITQNKSQSSDNADGLSGSKTTDTQIDLTNQESSEKGTVSNESKNQAETNAKDQTVSLESGASKDSVQPSTSEHSIENLKVNNAHESEKQPVKEISDITTEHHTTNTQSQTKVISNEHAASIENIPSSPEQVTSEGVTDAQPQSGQSQKKETTDIKANPDSYDNQETSDDTKNVQPEGKPVSNESSDTGITTGTVLGESERPINTEYNDDYHHQEKPFSIEPSVKKEGTEKVPNRSEDKTNPPVDSINHESSVDKIVAENSPAESQSEAGTDGKDAPTKGTNQSEFESKPSEISNGVTDTDTISNESKNQETTEKIASEDMGVSQSEGSNYQVPTKSITEDDKNLAQSRLPNTSSVGGSVEIDDNGSQSEIQSLVKETTNIKKIPSGTETEKPKGEIDTYIIGNLKTSKPQGELVNNKPMESTGIKNNPDQSYISVPKKDSNAAESEDDKQSQPQAVIVDSESLVKEFTELENPVFDTEDPAATDNIHNVANEETGVKQPQTQTIEMATSVKKNTGIEKYSTEVEKERPLEEDDSETEDSVKSSPSQAESSVKEAIKIVKAPNKSENQGLTEDNNESKPDVSENSKNQEFDSETSVKVSTVDETNESDSQTASDDTVTSTYEQTDDLKSQSEIKLELPVKPISESEEEKSDYERNTATEVNYGETKTALQSELLLEETAEIKKILAGTESQVPTYTGIVTSEDSQHQVEVKKESPLKFFSEDKTSSQSQATTDTAAYSPYQTEQIKSDSSLKDIEKVRNRDETYPITKDEEKLKSQSIDSTNRSPIRSNKPAIDLASTGGIMISEKIILKNAPLNNNNADKMTPDCDKSSTTPLEQFQNKEFENKYAVADNPSKPKTDSGTAQQNKILTEKKVGTESHKLLITGLENNNENQAGSDYFKSPEVLRINAAQSALPSLQWTQEERPFGEKIVPIVPPNENEFSHNVALGYLSQIEDYVPIEPLEYFSRNKQRILERNRNAALLQRLKNEDNIRRASVRADIKPFPISIWCVRVRLSYLCPRIS